MPRYPINMNEAIESRNPIQDIERCLAADDCAGAFRLSRKAFKDGKIGSDEAEDIAYRVALQSEEKGVLNWLIRLYEDTICRHGSSEDRIQRLATLYLIVGDKDSAFKLFSRLLQLESHDGEIRGFARYTLADLLMDKGQAERARKLLLPAIKSLPHDDGNAAPLLALMGRTHLAIGSPRSACRWYEKAMYLDPNETAWPKELALALEKLKEYGLAIKYWDRVLAIHPMLMGNTVCDSERPIYKVQEYMKNACLAKAHRHSCHKALDYRHNREGED